MAHRALPPLKTSGAIPGASPLSPIGSIGGGVGGGGGPEPGTPNRMTGSRVLPLTPSTSASVSVSASASTSVHHSYHVGGSVTSPSFGTPSSNPSSSSLISGGGPPSSHPPPTSHHGSLSFVPQLPVHHGGLPPPLSSPSPPLHSGGLPPSQLPPIHFSVSTHSVVPPSLSPRSPSPPQPLITHGAPPPLAPPGIPPSGPPPSMPPPHIAAPPPHVATPPPPMVGPPPPHVAAPPPHIVGPPPSMAPPHVAAPPPPMMGHPPSMAHPPPMAPPIEHPPVFSSGPPDVPPPFYSATSPPPPAARPPTMPSVSSLTMIHANSLHDLPPPPVSAPPSLVMPEIPSGLPPPLIVSDASNVPTVAPPPTRQWPNDWTPEETTSYLKLQIIRAKWPSLNPADTNPKASIFRISNNNNKPKRIVKTRVVEKTVNPEFNELFCLDRLEDDNFEIRFSSYIGGGGGGPSGGGVKTKGLKLATTYKSKVTKMINKDKESFKRSLGSVIINLKAGFRDFDTPNYKIKWFDLGGGGEVLLFLEYFQTSISGPTNVQTKNLDDILQGLWNNPEYKDILEGAGFKSKHLQKNPTLAKRVTMLFVTSPVPAPPPPPPPPVAPAAPPPPPVGGGGGSLMRGGGLSLEEQLRLQKGSLKEAEPIVKVNNEWKDDVQEKLKRLRAAFDSDAEDSEDSWKTDDEEEKEKT